MTQRYLVTISLITRKCELILSCKHFKLSKIIIIMKRSNALKKLHFLNICMISQVQEEIESVVNTITHALKNCFSMPDLPDLIEVKKAIMLIIQRLSSF